MVNTSFGSYEQFRDFFGRAPRKVQQILFNAYPKWARQLTEEYMASQPKITASKVSKPETKISRLLSNPTVKKATEAAKKAGDTISKANKSMGLLGKAGALASGIGGALTVLDPRTQPNEKVLGGMALIPHPLTRAGAVGGLLLNEGFKRAGDIYNTVKSTDPRYDYHAGDIINWADLAPELKAPSTLEEREKINKYNEMLLQQTQDRANKQLNEMSNMIAPVQDSPQVNTNGTYTIPTNSYNPPVVNKPTVTKRNIQNAQNAQQGGLNINQDIQYPIVNQEALTDNVAPVIPNLENLGPLYNTNANIGLQNVIDMASNAGAYGTQPIQRNEEQMMNNNTAPIPGDYNLMLNQMRPYAQLDNEPQNIREDILPQYKELMDNLRRAQQQDVLANNINAVANIMSNEPERAPIQWVTPWGIVTHQFNKRRPLNLPTNLSTNVDAFRQQIALQQAEQQAQAQQAQAQQDMAANMLQAEAFSKQYGGDPALYLDPKIRQQYLQSIINPEVSNQAQFKREAGLIPINLQADLAKQDKTIAGNLTRDRQNNIFDYYLMLGKEQGLNDRQAAQLANNLTLAQVAQEGAYERAFMEDKLRRDLAPYNRETQLMVADAYKGNRGQQTENPLNDMYKASQMFGTILAIPNPQQRQQAIDFINNLAGTNGPQINLGANSLTMDQNEILRRIRNGK